jgi:hypothetical protein
MYPASFAESSEGILYAADGINPVKRWDGYTAEFEDAGLPGPTTAVTASASGTGSITGDFYLFYSWIDRLGIESSLSPVSDLLTAASNDTVTYGSLVDVAPAQAVMRRFYRTIDGAARVAYLDGESSDLNVVTYSSMNTDDEISVNLARPLLDDSNRDITLQHRQPPDYKPYLVWHLQTMYYLGSARYSAGSVKVTQSSTTVRGEGTDWPPTFAGRFLYVDGGDASYEIASVDAANQTLTLTAAYTGDTDKFAGYTIEAAPGEVDLVYFSLPGQPEYVPAVNAFSLPMDNDVTTGGLSLSSFLYVLKRTRALPVHRPERTRPRTGSCSRPPTAGCVNNRCAVAVGERGLPPRRAGRVPVRRQRRRPGERPRSRTSSARGPTPPIHWPAAAAFHAVNDPGRDTVRFFVCLHAATTTRGTPWPTATRSAGGPSRSTRSRSRPRPSGGPAGRPPPPAGSASRCTSAPRPRGRSTLGGAAGDGVPGGVGRRVPGAVRRPGLRGRLARARSRPTWPTGSPSPSPGAAAAGQDAPGGGVDGLDV